MIECALVNIYAKTSRNISLGNNPCDAYRSHHTAYLNNTLIYSDGLLEDHQRKVKLVLKRLQEAGL